MRAAVRCAPRPPFHQRTGENQWHRQLHKGVSIRDPAKHQRNATVVVELSALYRSCSTRMTHVYGGEALGRCAAVSSMHRWR